MGNLPDDKNDKKPWSGRFSASTNALVEEFSQSVDRDWRLYAHDIKGSVAHAKMLAAIGVLSDTERDAIIQGLLQIQNDIEQGQFTWSKQLEDVHRNIEAKLIERIGQAGKKLHTARSRNDQIATDLRLYLRDVIDQLLEQLHTLRTALLDFAQAEVNTIMPGFTHLQNAQPITLGHHVMAWQEMFRRDMGRLQDARKRVNIMPLGSAALAGTSYPIDRNMTADLLGFAAVGENSLDGVSDRDFLLEFAAASAVVMTHLSRISEELVLWASPQFDFIELPDSYCTGSSIMPQKKNPDVPELIRGKAGRVFGGLLALLTLMKAQPLSYNRDNQEDKPPIFDIVDTLSPCLELFAALLPEIRTKPHNMRLAAERGFPAATDLADYLVRKGVAFRDAHEIVARCVAYGVAKGKDLAHYSLDEFKQFSQQIEADVYSVLDLSAVVAARNHKGATAPAQVQKAILRARAELAG